MKTRQLALTGLMIALVFVITRYFQVPIPQTKGYFNLGEAGIYMAAVLFGPRVAALAGGIGSALADLTSGASQFALFTLLIKGVEGLLVGLIAAGGRRPGARRGQMRARVLGMLLGGLVMVVGYFVTEAFLLGLGIPAALVEVPYNVVQVAVGAVAGLVASAAVERALPGLAR